MARKKRMEIEGIEASFDFLRDEARYPLIFKRTRVHSSTGVKGRFTIYFIGDYSDNSKYLYNKKTQDLNTNAAENSIGSISVNNAYRNSSQKGRDKSIEINDIPSFDKYVLMSPNEKSNAREKSQNKEFNTIESKFRSAEKIKPNKLLPIDSKEGNDYLLRSIDGHISNIKIQKQVSNYESKMSVKELDIRMKRVIKKHKETFTFGVPTSYSKLQSNIKSMIKNMENTEEKPKMGYSNEKQKRLYKHELLQESFQNKLGLVNKPTIEQLMIGDFIREKRQKSMINTQESKIKLKENVSD
jgi:hypothetical protein